MVDSNQEIRCQDKCVRIISSAREMCLGSALGASPPAGIFYEVMGKRRTINTVCYWFCYSVLAVF